jgi:hypothetical protein
MHENKLKIIADEKVTVRGEIEKVFENSVERLVAALNDNECPDFSSLRESDLFKNPPEHVQEFKWPEKLSYNAPIVGIVDNGGNCEFNFDNTVGGFTGFSMTQSQWRVNAFNPDNVGKVTILHENDDTRIYGMTFYDRAG